MRSVVTNVGHVGVSACVSGHEKPSENCSTNRDVDCVQTWLGRANYMYVLDGV